MIDTFFLAKSFVTLLEITDPVGVVPVFLAIAADASAGERRRAAWQAVAVAWRSSPPSPCSANRSSSTWASRCPGSRSPGGCCC